jgi:hypothetical protein
MGVMTYGTYLVKETVAPTSSWDPSTHTEGVDYIRFQTSPKRGINITYENGLMPLPGGSQIGFPMGTFSEQFTIDDWATETQLGYIEKFTQTHNQPATAAMLYLLVVTADGSPPTVRSWYRNSATTSAYLPVRLATVSAAWSEDDQYYKVKLALDACWT